MGPIFVKCGRNTQKRYICVFTCFSTRSVHLEVVHSLDANSFLQAFARFVGRRSPPTEVWSDNGSNFIGVEREMRQAVTELNRSNVCNAMLNLNATWHFNPPAASHEGGVRERIIRSVRKVLYALVQHRVLCDESLCTFVVEVGRVLNNRPITLLSNDPGTAPC